MERSTLLRLLATRILDITLPHPARVAVDGVDASGKTTLADALAEALPIATSRPVIRASIDRFHNPREIRYRRGADSPEGYYADSFDLPALKQKLLDPLGAGGNRRIQTEHFDFRSNTQVLSETILVAPDAVLLFDGIFLLRPELAGCWDLTIFLRVNFATVLARAIHRDSKHIGDAAAVVERYTRRYIPAQKHYLETCRPEERANIVIRNDNLKAPEILRILT